MHPFHYFKLNNRLVNLQIDPKTLFGWSQSMWSYCKCLPYLNCKKHSTVFSFPHDSCVHGGLQTTLVCYVPYCVFVELPSNHLWRKEKQQVYYNILANWMGGRKSLGIAVEVDGRGNGEWRKDKGEGYTI